MEKLMNKLICLIWEKVRRYQVRYQPWSFNRSFKLILGIEWKILVMQAKQNDN